MNLDSFLEIFPGRLTGPNANGWLNGRCPAHDDTNPSFGVKSGETGLLLKCQAGCTAEAIVGVLGIGLADLFYEEQRESVRRRPLEQRLRLEAEYPYPDRDGAVCLVKRRLVRPDGKKTFDWIHRNGSGTWEAGAGGLPPRLYNLPALLVAVDERRPVLLVEGEKDADTATELGWTATTAPESSSVSSSLLSPIAGAEVICIPDNDASGRGYVLAAAKLLPRARILTLPGVGRKEDLSDWAARQELPADALKRLVDGLRDASTADSAPGSSLEDHGFLTLAGAVALNVPRAPRTLGVRALDDLLGGGLGRGESVVIGGGPGSFKTTMLCRAASVLAGPQTAVLVVAHDEFFARVARKIGTGFQERYSELTSEYPPVLDRLDRKLKERDAYLVLDDARAARPLDVVVEAFAKVAPADRDVYLLLDHIHAVELSTFDDRDAEVQRVEKIASFLATLSKRGWATLALSEVTKLALSPAVVREAPLAAFAGSRKIASRADAAIVAVPGKSPRQTQLLAAKSRFGPKGAAIVELDPVSWTLATIDAAAAESEDRREADEKARADNEREDAAVLTAVREAILRGSPLNRAGVESRVSGRASRVRRALARLVDAGTLREELAPARSTGGRRGVVFVLSEGNR